MSCPVKVTFLLLLSHQYMSHTHSNTVKVSSTSFRRWRQDIEKEETLSLILHQPHFFQTPISPFLEAFGLRVHVYKFTFSVFFFFFSSAFVNFGRQFLLLWTVYTLFTHCAYTVHVLKNIKNRSHDTIYTFKYYFATVFSVFSFQFSAIISSIQTPP